MLDWCPQSTGITKRRWQSTSKAKSGPCASYNPLEELRKSAKHLIATGSAKHLDVRFEGPIPAQEDLLVVLGMWVHIVVKAEACGPYELLCDMAPYMKDERRDAWTEMFERMTITLKEA